MSELQFIECLLEHDVRQFLVRSQGLDKNAYREQIQTLNLLKQDFDFKYIVHHHADIFCENTSSSGLHLTSQSPSLKDMRSELGRKTLLGYSAHSLDEALKAEDDGADYVILGAIFPTPKAHDHHPVLGISTLREACQKLTIPVFAIGGINADNIKQVRDTNAYGFCALRALLTGDDLEHNLAKLQILWG